MSKNQYPNENWIIFNSDTILNTIQLFNNAKLVIGMHGAGLSNIVFANQDIPVLEFVPAKNFNCCYWHLANVMKQKYIMMPILNYDGNNSISISYSSGRVNNSDF